MYLPLHLRLTDRWVLVVGAGAVGRRRVALLEAAGARIRWVSPELDPALHPHIDVHPHPFGAHHCDGMDLVLACAPPAVNAQVSAAAAARRLWCGRADAPEAGDLVVPALLHRDPLVISLATGAPAATAALISALDAQISEGFQHFARIVAQARGRWAGHSDRAARLRRLISGPLAAVLECATAPDPADVERWLAAED